VGYVTVGIAGYRSLKIDPFTSSCNADRTDRSKWDDGRWLEIKAECDYRIWPHHHVSH